MRIYQIATGRAVVFEIRLLDKVCIVLQGVINAVVYGWSERMGVAWGSWLGIGERGGGRFSILDTVMGWCSDYLAFMGDGVSGLGLVWVWFGLAWTVFHST